jgi:agmatine deiminase
MSKRKVIMKRRYLNIILASAAMLILAVAGSWTYNRYYRSNVPKNSIPYTSPEYISGASTAKSWPAEFEKQEAIWMQWPSEVYNSDPKRLVTPEIIKVIKAFSPYIRVNVESRSNDEILQIKNLLAKSGYTGTNVHYYLINHLSIWTRDVGPVFVRDSQNKLNVADFGFNNYSRDGSQYYINTETQVHKLIANLYGFPLIKTNLISEGGAIESNGKGTMMVTEAVALKRNPTLTKLQIENEYKRVLGVKKVIWLKKGLAEDDNITSGHINEIARFSDPNTILLGRILPSDRYTNNFSKESYLRLEENYNILKNSTDQAGKPFRIIRVPMPPTLYNDTDNTGTLPVRSYLNYAVTNGAVIMQTYWRPGRSTALKDTEAGAKEILKGVFPGRNVIGIDAESINLWGGGIHCITQHMPAE